MIGGEKLDLYHLYFLVTQLGGIEKVMFFKYFHFGSKMLFKLYIYLFIYLHC